MYRISACAAGATCPGDCGSTVQGLSANRSSLADVGPGCKLPWPLLMHITMQCILCIFSCGAWQGVREEQRDPTHGTLISRGYWANAVVLLLTDSPSGGCSGLLLRPAGPSDAAYPHQHAPRTGKVVMYPDGSTTFTQWAPDLEDNSNEEELNKEIVSSQSAPVGHCRLPWISAVQSTRSMISSTGDDTTVASICYPAAMPVLRPERRDCGA